MVTRYVQKYPGDGRAMTYRGSLSAMKARESKLFWQKQSSLKQGLAWMDEGVSAVLKDKKLAGSRVEMDARLIRGITSAQIPKLFERSTVARSDLLSVVAYPQFHEMDRRSQASVYAWLAVLSQPKHEAMRPEDWLGRARAADVITANSIWEGHR